MIRGTVRPSAFILRGSDQWRLKNWTAFFVLLGFRASLEQPVEASTVIDVHFKLE